MGPLKLVAGADLLRTSMYSALRAPAKAGFKNVPDVFVNLRPSPV